MTKSTYVPLLTPSLKFKNNIAVDLLGVELGGVGFVRVDLMGLTH